MGNMAGGRPPSAGPGAWAETPAMGQMGGDPRMMNPGPGMMNPSPGMMNPSPGMMNPGPGMMNPSAGPGGMPRMSSGPPPSAFPRPPSFSTPASGGMGAGAGFAPPPTAGSMPGGPPSFTDRPGPGPTNAGTPSYDVVHLSARNARLEEKLSKALAKNRSMAKYYDQLLAKTRDAQEREIEDLKSDLMRLQAESAAALGARDSLQRVAAERDAAVEEMSSLRDKLSAIQRKGEGHDAQSTKELNDTRLKLAQRDGEVASLKAQLSSAQTMVSTATPAQTGASPVDHSGAVQAAGSTTLAQMQRMLDAAREERNHERRQAAARDGEMARQLNDIKEQALDRIRESSAAAKEVAALKERVHAAEHERDRLRDRMEEMEGDVSDHRELRRRMQQAEERATTTQKKADRCELSEAKLRAAEANAQNLQEERAQAHKRLQEMTEKLLHVTNEKDVLVRHSAHQVHVEAELANTRRELEQAKRSGLAVRTERKTHAVEWNEAADNMGRVLRHHIYSHTRWEKDASDEVSGAHEAHAHGQRSAVRLVAAAEAEAASLAGEAVEVVRTTRQLLREHVRECAEVIAEVTKVHAQRADERIDAALSMLREAEVRAERAESDAERSAAEARRAKAAATRAGVIPSALLNPHERDGLERLDEDGDPLQAERPQRGMVREEDFDDEAERATRRLRVSQFQMLGLAMWRRATSDARTEGHEMLHSQLVLARREAAVASARAENWERIAYNKGAHLRWSLLAAALLRKREKERRGEMDDVEFALTQKTLQLQVAVTERDASNEAAGRLERECAHNRALLEGLRREHDGALKQLQKEHGLRVEISDMVKHDSKLNPHNADVDLPVSQLQKTLEELSLQADRAAALAKAASAWGGDEESDEDLSDENADKENGGVVGPGAARRRLDRDLEACHDALIIMRDEDESEARARRAAEQSMGIVPYDEKGAFEKSVRAVRKHALQVKAELLAALVDGAEHARMCERLRAQCDVLENRLADTGEQLTSVRGATVARAFKGAVSRARDAQVSHARERELKAAAAKSKWGAAGLRAAAEAKDASVRKVRAAGDIREAALGERSRVDAAARDAAESSMRGAKAAVRWAGASSRARGGRDDSRDVSASPADRRIVRIADSDSDDDGDFGGYKPGTNPAASTFDDPNDFKIAADGSIIARGGGKGTGKGARPASGSYSSMIRARKAASRAGASSQKRAESAWSGGLRSPNTRADGTDGSRGAWDSTPMSPKPEPKKPAVSRTGLRAAKKNDLARSAYGGSAKSRR